MNPENVNPGNFAVDAILYNNEDFSIAYGTWRDGNKYLAMRWNGEENDPGYPKVFAHPMWFIIENELRLPFLRSLIGLPNSDFVRISSVINEILN